MGSEETVFEATTNTADLDARLDGELDIDAAQLIEEIQRRREDKFTIPKGAFTRKQFVKKTGCSKTRALVILGAEVEAGRLVVKQWPLATGGSCNIWMKAGE